MDTWIFWTVNFFKDPGKYMMASHMHSLKDPLNWTLDHHNTKCKWMTVLQHCCSAVAHTCSPFPWSIPSVPSVWQMWRNGHQRSKKVSGTHACFSSKVNFVIDIGLVKISLLQFQQSKTNFSVNVVLTFLWGHLKLELVMGFLSFYIWKM